MRFHVITLFPETIEPYVSGSILGRAEEKKLISTKCYNPRDFTKDPSSIRRRRNYGAGKWASKSHEEVSGKERNWYYRRVDRRPYGGGPGMVLEAEPFLKAAQKAKGKKEKRVKTVFFATDGKQFTNIMARDWAKKYDDIIFLSGRYEGIDARAAKILRAEKISVGPYILTGGELPAMIVIDAVARQIPGVLGKFESVEEKRVASPDVYTRPEVLKWKNKKYKVPKILLSGHHAKIESWKAAKLARSPKEGKSATPSAIQKGKNHHLPRALLGGNHQKIESWKKERLARLKHEDQTKINKDARSAKEGGLRPRPKI